MTSIRTDITDDAGIAALPTARRSVEYFLGDGLYLAVTPKGARKFIAYIPIAKNEGWIKSKPRVVGHWPTMSVAKARELAKQHRTKAVKQIKRRRMAIPDREYSPVTLQDALQPPWEKGE